MIRDNVKKLYGWEWPEDARLEAGSKALFTWLIEKRSTQNGWCVERHSRRG